MKNTSTHNLLVKQLYGEINHPEANLLNEQLSADWELKEEQEAMQEVLNRLNTEKYIPSDTSIRIILSHSRKTTPLATSC